MYVCNAPSGWYYSLKRYRITVSQSQPKTSAMGYYAAVGKTAKHPYVLEIKSPEVAC